MNKTNSGKPAMGSARRSHIHGPLVPMDDEGTGIMRWAIGGAVCGVLVLLAFAYACGPVGA